jgi:hypothetical protein
LERNVSRKGKWGGIKRKEGSERIADHVNLPVLM